MSKHEMTGALSFFALLATAGVGTEGAHAAVPARPVIVVPRMVPAISRPTPLPAESATERAAPAVPFGFPMPKTTTKYSGIAYLAMKKWGMPDRSIKRVCTRADRPALPDLTGGPRFQIGNGRIASGSALACSRKRGDSCHFAGFSPVSSREPLREPGA